MLIEDSLQIVSGAMILPSGRIGEGAMGIAGAVVTRNVTAQDRVAGNPARSIVKTKN